MSYISAIQRDNKVLVWERLHSNEREIVEYDAPYYFYVDDTNGEQLTIYDTPVKKIDCGSDRSHYFKKRKEFQEKKIKLWEGDIGPELRVLSNMYYNVPAPKLNVTFIDIENNYDIERGFSGPKNPYAEINAISLFHEHKNEMVLIAVPPPEELDVWTPALLKEECNKIVPLATEYTNTFYVCKSEHELLEILIKEINNSDLLCGWNSDKFDFPFIGKRIELVLGKHRLRDLSFPSGDMPRFVDVEEGDRFRKPDPNAEKQTFIRLETSGRLLADYMVLYKKYEASEKPSYKLSSISEDVLVDADGNPTLPKLEYGGSLHNLYHKDFAFFCRYNIRDSEILHGFEVKLGYVELANQMYHLSCGLFQHVPGTLKLAELAIINHCHHVIKKVVNNITEPPIDKAIEGALVLLPQTGLHELLGSIDINSLYPTAIRSVNISPEKLYGQFIEEARACIEIANNSDAELTLIVENTKEEITATASEWRTFLLDSKKAVSGYGTVFNQDSQGIIPAVLTDWFAQRKRYQAMKAEALLNHDEELAAYYDRLQYVYKIKLNSLYGALSNLYFRFYDLRMGESTTGTGRMILRHQCRKVNEIFEGEYNIDFPMYETVDQAANRNHPDSVALHGPTFKGKFQSNTVIYGDSVTGDTNIDILTDKNYNIRIDHLFQQVDYTTGEKEYCNITNIKALTYDKQHNKTCYKNIKYVMRHKCSKQLYRVWITNSQWIDVTEDHSLIGYVNSSKQKKYKDFITEVKPSELGNDIKSLVYVKHKPQHAYQDIFTFSPLLYELMGYVLGDGYVDTTPTGGVLLSVGEKHITDIEFNLLLPLQREGWISSWTIKPNKHDIQISSVKLRKFLRSELYQNNIKTIPNWIQHEHPVNISSFLRGWFSADGFINKNYVVGLCSVNEQHIKIAQEMLFKLGISSTYFTETTQNSYKGKFSGTFTKRLTIKSISKFKELIGFITTDKHEKLSSYKEGTIKKSMSKYDFEIVNPIKIEKLPIIDDYVYDIEVEDTHTFFANNILVHNTDSTYFVTGAETVVEAIQIADYVADKVNASYQSFMQNTFLCQPEFDNLVKCAREVVSDRGIFVEKKRYILHLVDLDGKTVDKCKVMGLDTKKTTLPSHISIELNKFIERYLKGETWEEVSVSIVDYKEHLRQATDVMEIGLPKGIKNVEEYTRKYEADGTTRLPGHVAAAIHYNMNLKHFEDKISLPIMSGMKIKVFYLKSKYGRFKSIAIPTDAEFVPDWFIENFEIDRDAHIERLIDNPLQNILKAVDKRVPTVQSLIFDEEWSF